MSNITQPNILNQWRLSKKKKKQYSVQTCMGLICIFSLNFISIVAVTTFLSSNHIYLLCLKKNLHTLFYILRQRFLQRKQLIISQRISDCQSLLKSALFLFAFFIFSYYFLVCWLSFIIHASMKVLLWITNWSLKQF